MKNQENKKNGDNGGLFPILMVNSFIWALAIIMNLIVFHSTGQDKRLFVVLLVGTVVSIVAVSKAWKNRKKNIVS